MYKQFEEEGQEKGALRRLRPRRSTQGGKRRLAIQAGDRFLRDQICMLLITLCNSTDYGF